MRPGALRPAGWWSRAGRTARARGPLLGPPIGHAPCERSLCSRPLADKRVYRPRRFHVPLRFASRGHPVGLRVACSLRCAATFNVTPGATLNAAGRVVRARPGREQLRASTARLKIERRRSKITCKWTPRTIASLSTRPR